MSLSFVLKEGFSSIGRAKLPAAITVAISFFSLVLLGLFGTVSLSFYDVIQELRGRVELEVFFSDSMNNDAAGSATEKMKGLAGVEEVSFVSREEAARIFSGEFGEDVVAILGSNPLPRSARISVQPGYASADSLAIMVPAIREVAPGSDIRYNKAFLGQIEENARLFTFVTGALGILISVATVVMIGYTIRLAMHARQEKIRTMRLVGASGSIIAAPYIIEGALQGLLSGLLAAGALALLFELGIARYEPALYMVLRSSALLIYPSVVLLGLCLGFMGSAASVGRSLRLVVKKG
ncbi:ABC transporter permease [Chlorobium phaeovibrioides]|uniref:Cell division protein FtsX n=1 Tax=Chlorobium phaeovibrioides TaxID=1094 RepID=A0A432ATY7_CHLPH|nr:permease-like cell division protein FtsX [Chlorobium phaeovibrioides]KAA6232135.1 ABC transporter permease [Chlorobium phaeovibrioides]RTY34580.1 ABC transporter permease [Chlorobium phaeovibrioides]RTY37150.1 ABC transporter permease [Chlorobium phaeovibrioides]